MTTIIAIGGDEIGVLSDTGELNPVATHTIHQEIIAKTGKERPKALFIPTAKGDSEEYIRAFEKYYLSLGCSEVDTLKLIRRHPTRDEIAAKIFSADIIYVNGGNTHRMMRLWKRRGVIELLIKAHKQGIVMAGHSAGAICWFAGGNSDSFNKRKPFKAKAIGIIDALLCPHYDTEKARASSLKKMMKKTSRIIAIALDECAAIEIIDGEYRIISSTPYAKARKTFWKNNRYYTEEIAVTSEMKNLEALLAKIPQETQP